MSGYVLTLAAEDDIDQIWQYLALEKDNTAAADRVKDDLYRSFEFLATMPRAGHVRQDLTQRPVLFWPVRNTYYVVYRIDTDPLTILRVLHGRRDVFAILAVG